MQRRSRRHDVEVSGQAGYGELIRGNVNFRRLWVGNIVSLLGDWFNTIALYTLVTKLTASPFALGAVFIFKMLPWALASPVAGIIVDRFNRRRLMIGSDLFRAVIVLGFLLIDEAREVYWLCRLLARQRDVPRVRCFHRPNSDSAADGQSASRPGAARGGAADC